MVKGKRWHIEYYLDKNGVKIRHRVYGQLNRIKSIPHREARALELIQGILADSTPKKSGKSVLEKVLHETRASYRPKTYSTYKSKLKSWLKYIDGKADLAATKNDASAFLNTLQGCKANATIRAFQRTLFSLYKKAEINPNPFADLKTNPPRSKSLKPFTDAHCKAILSHSNNQLRIAIWLLFYCFIRPGEVRYLRIDDIDFDRQLIEIRGEISKNKKTQKVAIPNAIFEPLQAFTNGRSGLLLLHPKTKKMLPKDWLYRQHQKILQKLDINGRYSLYSWKHTGAIKAVQAGINLKDLQNQLRHHSLDMVNEYLKDLGVMDSSDLKTKFPNILG